MNVTVKELDETELAESSGTYAVEVVPTMYICSQYGWEGAMRARILYSACLPYLVPNPSYRVLSAFDPRGLLSTTSRRGTPSGSAPGHVGGR